MSRGWRDRPRDAHSQLPVSPRLDSPSSVKSNFDHVVDMPYEAWASMIESLPELHHNQCLNDIEVNAMVERIETYLSIFRSDGQPCASNILLFILSEVIIKVKRLITDDNIKILISTKLQSKNVKKIKCGDLIGTMNHRELIILLLLVELSIRQPSQAPAQLLQEMKFLYEKYQCERVTAAVVYSGFMMLLITFSDIEQLPISHHSTITQLSVSVSRTFIIERSGLIKLLQYVYGLLVAALENFQQHFATAATAMDHNPTDPDQHLAVATAMERDLTDSDQEWIGTQ